MTMNTLGLGAAVRPAARVSAKKASFTGAPVVGKSSFAVRKTVAPKAGRVVAMAAGAEPIMEAPFKGIKDDLAARSPLYIDDFKQGISTKSLVRVPIFPIIRLPPFSKRTRSGVRRVARDPAREREKLCAPPFEFGRRPRDTSSRSSRGAPARGSRDDDARTTSLVPFFSNGLPRGPCWVIHRGFFLEQDARRTFCTSQLAEPFICEGTETDARRDAATDQKTDRSVFSSPLVPSRRRRPSSSCSSPRSPPRSRSARCSLRRRRACSARRR